MEVNLTRMPSGQKPTTRLPIPPTTPIHRTPWINPYVHICLHLVVVVANQYWPLLCFCSANGPVCFLLRPDKTKIGIHQLKYPISLQEPWPKPTELCTLRLTTIPKTSFLVKLDKITASTGTVVRRTPHSRIRGNCFPSELYFTRVTLDDKVFKIGCIYSHNIFKWMKYDDRLNH